MCIRDRSRRSILEIFRTGMEVILRPNLVWLLLTHPLKVVCQREGK